MGKWKERTDSTKLSSDLIHMYMYLPMPYTSHTTVNEHLKIQVNDDMTEPECFYARLPSHGRYQGEENQLTSGYWGRARPLSEIVPSPSLL